MTEAAAALTDGIGEEGKSYQIILMMSTYCITWLCNIISELKTMQTGFHFITSLHDMRMYRVCNGDILKG